MGRNSETLFLVSRSAIHRIDRAGSAHPVIFESLPRHPEETLAESVGMMVRSKSRRLGRVWIACTDAWVGEIELDRRVAHAIGSDGLEETLALEAENLSGIPAFSSRIASVPQTVGAMAVKSALPNAAQSLEQRFKNPSPNVAATANHIVLQVDANELEAIAAEIKEHRGKLLGVGSAALLQVPHAHAGGVSVIVSELESGTIFARNLGASHLTVMSADRFDLQRWRRNFGDSLGGPLAEESTLAILADLPDAETSTNTSGTVLTWDDPSLVVRWAQWWIEAAHSDKGQALLVKPAAKPLTNAVWTAIALGAAAIVAIAGILWQIRANNELSQIGAELETLRQNKAIPAQLERAVATTAKDLEVVKQDYQESATVLNVALQDSSFVSSQLELRKKRWDMLLNAVALSASNASFIESLHWIADDVAIEGHSESAVEAHRIANELRHRLATAGWQVRPARTEFTDNGLYQFRVLARPATTPSPTVDGATL